MWGTAAGDENIVWGTSGDENVVWGTAAADGNVVWGTAGSLTSAWISAPDGTQTPLTGSQTFDRLTDKDLLQLLEYSPPPAPPPPSPPPPVSPPPAVLPVVEPLVAPVVPSTLVPGGGI